jgi:peptidoglycan hydrolase CwlO-like protein
MRRFSQVLLVGLVVVLVGGVVELFQKYRETSSKYLDMRSAEQTAREQYAEAFNSIAEIQDSLNAIRIGEGAVRLAPNPTESRARLNQPSRQEVMESIALLDASIQRTKQRIGELEHSLKKSQMKVAGLMKMVDQLKASVAEREAQITELNGKVTELQTQVTGLQTSVQEAQDSLSSKAQLLAEDQHDIETVYVLIGTKKELASSGVIIAKGGVLGLGKTVQLSGKFDDNLFHPLDTHDESVIRAAASKAQVLSSQPVSSYELKLDGKQVELHILNPAEFRKVKHVVIMTA